LEKFSPFNYKKLIESYVPSVSLNREDIRHSIWSWNEADLNFLLRVSHKNLSNEIYRYAAAYQIIKQAVEEAKNKGIENPLNTLLTKLKEQKDKQGKPSGSEEIIFLIQENLNVKVKAIGILDEQSQKKLGVEAIDLLSQKEITSQNKKYAFNILVGIDKFYLREKWLKFLLDEFYFNNEDDQVLKELAATALAMRINQPEFDMILQVYLKENQKLKKNSIKKVKKDLENFSIRPVPK
jgi:hypothetical protein